MRGPDRRSARGTKKKQTENKLRKSKLLVTILCAEGPFQIAPWSSVDQGPSLQPRTETVTNLKP